MRAPLNAVVAGHICLDIIPDMRHIPKGEFEELFQPGHLLTVGPATFSTGGAVSNTGLALHHLDVPTQLIGKVGTDPFSEVVRDVVRSYSPHLADGIVTDPASPTSYTVIVNPPGVDRIFLHCPGANDTFCAADVDEQQVAQAALFHFGYPPIMQRMYENHGEELIKIFERAKASGATTSLDMSLPDPSSDAGWADWITILTSVLPFVDIFMPSIEELLFMLQRSVYEHMRLASEDGSILAQVTPKLLSSLGRDLTGLGVKILMIKLGERGIYLRTAEPAALEKMGRACPSDPEAWADQELWAPCFKVDVVGTTGAGDATIAGFLSALLRDMSPIEAATTAVAVGACNVEAADALSGLRTWDDTWQRIQSGWERHTLHLDAPGWHFDEGQQLWISRGPSITAALREGRRDGHRTETSPNREERNSQL